MDVRQVIGGRKRPRRRTTVELLVVLAVLAGLAVAPWAGAAPLFRVNAGGPAVSTSPSWSGDTSASPSSLVNASATGNRTYSTTTGVSLASSVPSGTPSSLFQSHRWDALGGSPMIWTFPVTPGQYEVRLYFAEVFSVTSKAGARVFDVTSEGLLRLDDVDVFSEAGGANKGIMRSFVVSADSSLDVTFVHGVENPMVSAIEVLPGPSGGGQLAATPSSLSFGDVGVGGSSAKTVTLTNTGASGDPSISISDVTVSGTSASQFTAGSPGSTTLAPGASTSLSVSFKPTSTGTKAATLAVSHSGTNSPLSVGLSGNGASATTVSFGKSGLTGETSDSPTTLQFGPDGRLYVGHFGGLVKVYDVTRNGPSSYAVTATQTITSIQAIPNHDDLGQLQSTVTKRIITGLLVAGTAANPVVYVTSSDPRIGGGSAGTDLGLDTNSSMLSKLTWNGSSWSKLDLVRGLPRSEENHSSNGIALDASKNVLYISQGGNTNAGAPSNNFALLSEYALSAAILSVDLAAIGNTTYDLPTLDDGARSGTTDAGDPFGGNDGANQAKLVTGGPVQVHAPGFRNPYDVLIDSAGRMYSIDNGGNAGWGAPPVGEGPGGTCTNQTAEPGLSDPDALHLITGKGYYGGHPNPTRGNTANTFSSPKQSPVPSANAVECDHRRAGTSASTALTTFPASTNGLVEYTAGNFGGAMKGDLLAGGYSANAVHRMELSSTGTAVTSNTALFSTVGANPLDVTAVGDTGKFPGTIWVADIGSGAIHVFEPADYGGTGGTTCTGADSTTVDEDGDGFSNADEIDNGTNPCSSADVPPDADDDEISDLNDPDDDNDGSPDTNDAFAVDPDDGLGTALPATYTWDNGAPVASGLLNLGFTGLMTNGTSNYQSLYDPEKMTTGGAAGVLTVDEVTSGDALGSTNTQSNALQFGVKPPSGVFTAHTRVLSPFSGITPTGQQSFGLFVGDGTQNGYTKVVVTAGGGETGVQSVHEVNGTPTSGPLSAVTLPGPDAIDLYLTIDPAAKTVQAAYGVVNAGTAGPVVSVGSPWTVPSGWLTSTSKGLAAGIISTSAGGPVFAASWDSISVATGGPATGTTTGSSLRVNAGGPEVSGTPVWSQDTAASPSPYVNAAGTGNRVHSTTATVAAGPGVPAGTPPSVLQSQRWDALGGESLTWNVPVTPGDYDLRLYFAETYSPNFAVGKRVFDVLVDGQLALNDVDPFKEAGAGNTAIMKTVPVTAGSTLTVAFKHVVENPAVQAIEIVPRTSSSGTLAATPSSLTFSSTEVSSSTSSSVVLTHTGAAGSVPVTVSGATVSGTDAADFSVAAAGSVTRQPGQNTTRTVTFAPKVAGTRTATLAITHDGQGSPLTVPLSGTATTTTTGQDQGSWTTEPAMPAARAEVGVASVGTKVYVVGGNTDTAGLSDSLSIYDTAAKTWTTGPAVPGPARDHAGVVALGGQVYVLGGLTGYPGPSVSSVYAFNPATESWSTKASMPTARGAMAVAVSGGKILAAGGLGGGVSVKDLAVYDPVGNSWTTQAAMPAARHHLSGEAVDGVFYAIGGRTGSLTGDVATVEAFDTASGTWSTKAPLPVGRGGAGSAVLNGRIYFFGGDGNPASGSGGVYDLNHEYDPATNTWRSVAPLLTARHGTDGAVVNGKVYAPGGGKAQGTHDSADNDVFALELKGV